jgi:NADPH:quinone reductase-like Zn-dependent oxidoreductase
MKAAVYRKYGAPDVVRVLEVPTPEAKAGQVLIRIHATTISAADWRARSLDMPRGFGLIGRFVFGVFGPRKPVLGLSFSGEIVAIGDGVTRFAVGDAVFGVSGLKYFGCHAEFIALPETATIVHKPNELSHKVAASLGFGGNTALFFLRDKAKVKPGERIAVIGASGTVGSACVQLARHFGAHVTGVTSTKNLDLVRSIGADEVIDYTAEDISNSTKRWDVIVDCAGTTRFPTHRHLLNPNGRLCFVLSDLWEMLRTPFNSRSQGRRAVHGTGNETKDDLQLLADLAVDGAFVPLIDSEYPLQDIVAAHARVDTGRKRGAVVVLP